jgi:hypothetical protein
MFRHLRTWAIVAGWLFSASLLAQVEMTIRVLQSERVPYDIEPSKGSIIAGCSIVPSVNTADTATAPDNTASPNTPPVPPKLSMRCNSPEPAAIPRRPPLHAMLVMGSDRTAYIIACENTWRWSKCQSLTPGNIFRAQVSSKEMIVMYMDEGMQKKRTYHILQEKAGQ